MSQPETIRDEPLGNFLGRILSGKRTDLDEQGRYKEGTYKGMTPAEVEQDRENFRRIVGE